MARGKHAVSAQARQAISSRDADITSYQKAIAQLTKERNALRRQLADKDQAHRAEVRRLKAERDEGLSPMVATLQRETVSATERAQAAEQRASEIHRRWDTATDRLLDYLESLGMKKYEAIEKVLHLVGGEHLHVTDGEAHESSAPAVALAMQRRQGLRR